MIYKEAIILAGGAGNRLRSVVSDRPKPMADIHGRPFLEYLFDYLKKEGITRLVLSVGYLSHTIEDHFKDSYLGMDIIYAREEVPLGTGGGIKNALRFTMSDSVFIINGDTYFPVKLQNLEDKYLATGAEMVMALYKVSDPERYGTLSISEEGKILDFGEKTQVKGEALINGGIYLASKELFNGRDLPAKFSLEQDLLGRSADSIKLYGIVCREMFIDIGIPESYREAKHLLS